MSGRAGRRVVGTAGHIDHGKTALVAAMTGVDTDRLPEERERGISIDLGFAALDLGPDAPPASVVDVPGHEGFVRNMVAGASGIDAVLLVVAADEGVMPQTREHLLVVEALGVERGVVAVTKADLVEPGWIELVVDEVEETLAGTSLAGAPVVPVSARTGEGVEEVRAALTGIVAATPARDVDVPFRLPVDRAFPVAGVGTVVTGTVWGGAIGQGEAIRILPADETTRVRSIEIHGAPVDRAEAGSRAALGLVDAPDDLGRGAVLVSPDRPWSAARRIDARLRLAAGAPRPVEYGDRVRVLHGTREVMARVRWYDGEKVGPGGGAVARLDLEDALVTAVGDRLVIRAYSPVETIGGGVVLALDPRRVRGRDRRERGAALAGLETADPAGRLEAAIAAAGEAGVADAGLPIATGLGEAALGRARREAGDRIERHGDRWFAASAREALAARLLETLETHHAERPLEPGLSLEAARQAVRPADPALVEAAIERLEDGGRIERRGARLARAGHEVEPGEEDRRTLAAMREAYAGAGLEAPETDALARALGVDVGRLRDLQRYLEEGGALRKLASDWYVDAAALDAAERKVVERIERGGPADVGDLKDLFDLSRKYLIPLLEYLDRAGVTRRDGDRRVLATRVGMVLLALAPLVSACASSSEREVPPPGREDRTNDPEFVAAREAAEREFESQADALEAGVYEPFVHPDSVRPARETVAEAPPETPPPGRPAAGDPTTEELIGTLGAGARYDPPRERGTPDVEARDERWTLQVGAYRSETGALVRIGQMASEFPDLPRWHEVGSDGFVRVYLGRFGDRASAERVLAELFARGEDGTVVREP